MNSQKTLIVNCPTCKKPLPWVAEQVFKPFCSQRCRLIDLGDWATEAHKIPGESIFTLSDGEFSDPES